MRKHLTTILCITVLALISDGNAFNPCVDYETLDQTLLGSRNEICPRSENRHDRLCDYRLASNWYLIPHNGVLKNTCPATGSCGADFPVWLNGTLPIESDGIVDMTCCLKISENCCYDTINIQVKNCSNMIVYYLPSLDFCDSVYCIDTDLPCGQTTTQRVTTKNVLTTPGDIDVESDTSTKPALTNMYFSTKQEDTAGESDTSTKPALTNKYFSTTPEDTADESADKISMLIGICIGMGVFLCIVAGVAVYFIYISRRYKSQLDMKNHYADLAPHSSSPETSPYSVITQVN